MYNEKKKTKGVKGTDELVRSFVPFLLFVFEVIYLGVM